MADAVETLQISVERVGPRLDVVLVGEIDFATAPMLAATVIEQLDREEPEVWLDLAGVTFCDSAGVGTFVRLQQEATGRGGQLTLFEPRGSVERVLRVTHIDELIPIARHPELHAVDTDVDQPGVE